jgi:hypothetical protein
LLLEATSGQVRFILHPDELQRAIRQPRVDLRLDAPRGERVAQRVSELP